MRSLCAQCNWDIHVKGDCLALVFGHSKAEQTRRNAVNCKLQYESSRYPSAPAPAKEAKHCGSVPCFAICDGLQDCFTHGKGQETARKRIATIVLDARLVVLTSL